MEIQTLKFNQPTFVAISTVTNQTLILLNASRSIFTIVRLALIVRDLTLEPSESI